MQDRRFQWFFYLAAVATLTLAAALVWLDQQLVTPASPQGIISLELAGTPDKARLIIDSWGLDGLHYAVWSLLLDFPFLISYVVLFVCLTRLIDSPVKNLLIGGFVLAGLCDLIENLALLQLLSGKLSITYTQTAFWCASVKFGLLVFGWGYLLICGVYGLYRRFSQR